MSNQRSVSAGKAGAALTALMPHSILATRPQLHVGLWFSLSARTVVHSGWFFRWTIGLHRPITSLPPPPPPHLAEIGYLCAV